MRSCRRFLAGIPHRKADTHAFLTRPPLPLFPKEERTFDLHVLGTPPAFILSQDQTRHPVLYSRSLFQGSHMLFCELSLIDRYKMCYCLFLTTLQLFWCINAYAFISFLERMRDNITAS